jgi:hypothetical protein
LESMPGPHKHLKVRALASTSPNYIVDSLSSWMKHPNIIISPNLLRKEEIHTVLYVVTVTQFEVFQKIRELQLQKSVKLSRARNPRKFFTSLATLMGMPLKGLSHKIDFKI